MQMYANSMKIQSTALNCPGVSIHAVLQVASQLKRQKLKVNLPPDGHFPVCVCAAFWDNVEEKFVGA